MNTKKVCILGAPNLESNITRRVDFALFMVAALVDELVHEGPAIVGCQTPSALAIKAQSWSLREEVCWCRLPRGQTDPGPDRISRD